MKRIIHLGITLIYLVLWQTTIQAAIKYWDIDDSTPGAGGDAPSGTWNTGGIANWTTSSTGSSGATTWADGDDAVFSAGTNATNIFSVTLDNSVSPPVQNAGNLTVEEGAVTIGGDPGTYLNIGGGIAGKGIINIAGGLNATISAELDSTYAAMGDDTGQLTKTGTGTLTLSGANFIGSTFVMAAGVVAAANNIALGSGQMIVSNGAALHILTPSTGFGGSGTPVILNGDGPDITGAIRSRSGNNVSTSSGALLGSDARIQNDGGGRFDWNTTYISGTSGGNNWNLIIGGNGGRVRLNAQLPINRSFDLGTGVLTKEGTCLLQLENPNICSAFHFNGGSIYPRYPGFGTNATIFIGGSGGTFAALFQDIALDKNMLVASGATVGFNCNQVVDPSPAVYNATCTGVISGLGGLSKTNTGTLLLTKHNTYAGNTTIEWGFLTLGPSGSISNSAVINLQSTGSVFNVTSNAGGFVLQLAQTLKGNGTVLGNMNAKGTISPGASVGSLTNEGNLTLGGSLLIEVDKSLAPNSSNDMTTVSGTLSHSGGGALTVANLGPTLAVNDSFQVFNKAVTGGQTITVSGGGATWTNKLAVDGSIAVVSLETNVPATNLTIQAAGPTSVGLGGMGAANSAYSVYASTNVALPMSSWWKIGTTNSSGGGAIQFLDSQATNSQRFYRFGQP